MTPNCLNCNEPVSQHFCAHCGQKTDTHRLNLKHFFLHDVLHGVWHFEKGMLFTIKETFARPGQAALDYIQGKRVRYYNVFYLCLLLIGANFLLSHYYESYREGGYFEGNSTEVKIFFSKYSKFVILSLVPLLSLNAWLVFRRLRLNLAEHFILAGIALLGILLLTMVFNFVNFVMSFEAVHYYFGLLKILVFLLLFLYPVWVYANAVKGKYSAYGKSWRILLFYFLVCSEILFVLLAIFYALNGSSSSLEINM